MTTVRATAIIIEQPQQHPFSMKRAMLLTVSLSLAASLGDAWTLSSMILPSRPRMIQSKRFRSAIPPFQLTSSLTRVSSIRMMNGGKGNRGQQEEDDCPSEEECEIDWSKMPSSGEDEPETKAQEDTVETAATGAGGPAKKEAPASLAEKCEDDEDDDDEDIASNLTFDPSKARLRLEMQWGVQEATEDCSADDPETCGSETCLKCHGRGATLCRFCHGSAVLSFTREEAHQIYKSTLMNCPVCNAKGVEPCVSCKGTGWIAGWTQLPRELEEEELEKFF